MIVGRDTANLDEAGVARAAVESVAESMVDGVTAPLFFALLGGPMAAMLYKAINTMDSMFGYKNEQYFKFGWAAARLDDLANFVPARITSLMIPAAAFLLRLDPKALPADPAPGPVYPRQPQFGPYRSGGGRRLGRAAGRDQTATSVRWWKSRPSAMPPGPWSPGTSSAPTT